MYEEPTYKWPLIVLFILLTPLGAWTGWRLAIRPNGSKPVVEQPGEPESGDIFVTSAASKNTPVLPASTNQRVSLERCVVKMAQANDPTPPLSIRNQPSPTASVVGEVNNEQFLDVVNQQGEWFAITSPAPGWVPKALTNYSCNTKLAKIQSISTGQSAGILGRFIGTGTHVYKLSLEKGQELTITGRSGSGQMPTLMSPSQAVLFEGPQNGEADLWSGKLRETGEYQLVLDSNFQGYGYAFNLDVK